MTSGVHGREEGGRVTSGTVQGDKKGRDMGEGAR